MEFKIKHNNNNNNKIRYLFIIFIIQQLLWIVSGNFTTLINNNTEEEDKILIECDEADCLKCTSIYGCIRCPNLITYDDRRCVNECPRGYIEQWSTVPELMGRVCRSNGYSDPILATIVGLAIGATVCIILVVLGIVMIKRKQRQRHMSEQLIDDTIEREDFLKQLNELRPNAEYYLAMLNDLRRTIRKLYLSGDINGANYYRPIIRDLSKILILINRPVELLHRPPHDWNHVYVWGLRIIERYKPQITQLIDFLQNPSSDHNHHHQQQQQSSLHHILDPRLHGGSGGGGGGGGTGSGSSKYSTFKSTNTARTELNDNNSNSNSNSNSNNNSNNNNSNNNNNNNNNQNSINNGKDMVDLYQMKIFGSMINLHDNDNLHSQTPSKNPFRNSLHTLSKGSPSSSSDIHGSSLWLENEFFKLGFRPQDEITTEL